MKFRAKQKRETMGEMHENITPRQLCKITSTDEDTMRARFTKLHKTNPELFPERWRIDRELTAAQTNALIKGGERKGSAPKDETTSEARPMRDVANVTMTTEQGRPNEVAPQGDSIGWRAKVFVAVAFAIVMGHAGLIWFDMGTLWAMPGKIGGGVVFAFILGGMILMSDSTERMAEIRENMLWAVTLLESLAIVVHQATFYRAASEAFVAGLGASYTWALAAVICLCSIGATIFYQRVIQ